jgi:hypothetical protein
MTTVQLPRLSLNAALQGLKQGWQSEPYRSPNAVGWYGW